MSRILRLAPFALLVALAALAVAVPDAGADDRKLFVGFREIPYVFILFDTSSSMAAVTDCTQEDFDAGFCSQVCDRDGGGCMAPLNADDPASKLYEAKQILYEVLLETENVDFGFATLNQDDVHVRRKHWVYQAANDGPSLPSSNPPLTYPATGQKDVFGPQWPCTSGGSDIGCGPQNDAADLTDPYAAQRMERFPRGGINAAGDAFDSTTAFYVGQGSRDYKIVYGIPSGIPGATSVTVDVTACESDNGGDCSGGAMTVAVTYDLVGEFLSFDLGPDPNGNDQFEEFEGLDGFFAQADNLDVLADMGTTENGVGQCGGLDMNDDTTDDIYVDPYNLRWPTTAGGACSGSGNACTLDSDCPAGETCEPAPLLDVGDFIPLDWKDGHKQLILSRLAPNILLGEGTPDFSISRYFEDPAGDGPNGALELLDENVRPIIPTAKTPLDSAIADFREWYDGCRHQPNCAGADDGWEEYAATRDPNWGCRKVYLLIFTDGDVTCQEGGNACNATANMNSQLGVETFVIAYGTSSDEQQPGGGNQSTLTCLPANSGAGQGQEVGALFPHNRQELLDALKLVFSAIVGRTATFSAAAVPSVQAEALDKLFLTSLSPVNEHSVWPGRMDAFLKPLPLDAENRPDTTKTCPDPSNNASNCHLWNAAEVMLTTQVDATDPVGQTAGQRRITYSQFPLDASVPLARESFESSTNRSVAIEVERDFWRGLGINFVPGDTASEDAARTESDGIITETLAVKTGTLPPPEETEIDYVMGEIFHSDPAVVGSPTNNLYFIADLNGDDDDTTDCTDGDPGYRCFFFKHQKRRKVLGAGSNDGMFHLWDIGAWSVAGDFVDRFDNGTGKEIFGYMPRTVLPVVKRVTEEPIAPQYAVDGRPSAADVFIDPVHDGTPTEADREWRTVVMGGLRSGGWTTQPGFSNLDGPIGSEGQKAASYFLLDVTQPDPVSLSDPDFVPDVQDPPACLEGGVIDCGTVPYGTPLWEFTDTILAEREEGDPDDDSDNVIVGVRLDEESNGFIDLAPTWSTPNIGRIRICVGGSECNPAVEPNDVEERYVAVFGGGLDENELTFHARGNFLYIVDVETGETLYKQQVHGATPSEPAAVDTNLDGFLDTIYLGTTFGFLYRADLETIVGGNTTVPQLTDVTVSGTMADGTAVVDTQQRITDALHKPYILFNANDASVDDVIVGVAGGTLRPQQMYYRPSVIFVPNLDRYALAFGTGNRADLFDRGETNGGRFFVVVDDVTQTQLQDPAFVPPTPLDLRQVGLADARSDADFLVDFGGWWYQLASNQRVVTESFALSGVVFFSSFIPADQAIIVEESPQGAAPGPNPPQPGDFFCREAGTSQIFASLATNGNGLLFVPNETDPVRFRTVEDLATRPYTELSQTANPVPDEPPPPLSAELLQIQEELKELFPANCKFPPGYNIGVKTRVTDTGIEFIAPVPICVIEKNFKDY